MKRCLVIIFLTFFITLIKAQDAIVFKIKYLPGHTYQINSNISFIVNTDLSQNKEIASTLTSKGITQPMQLNVNYKKNAKIITDLAKPDQSFSFNIIMDAPYITGTLNGSTIPIPPSKAETPLVYGHVNAGGTMSIDSLKGQKLTDSISVPIKKMINGLMSEVNFPPHPIKIGESFTQYVPLNMNIPITGNGINVSIKITYKLARISGGKAYFNLVEGMDMNADIKNMNVIIAGKGDGEMVYDINNNFAEQTISHINMSIVLKSDKLNAAGTANISSENNYTIN